MEEYERAKSPVVIAASSYWVKIYGGLQLSSSPATHYYFNPDIPETHEILIVYEQFLDPPTIQNVQQQRFADIEQEKTRNRVTIGDLQRKDPQHQKNVRFTVIVTIDRIDTKRPWYFNKWPECHTKIHEHYPHAHCQGLNPSTEPEYSYSFKVYIRENIGEIMLTCFSNEANCIVKDCNELMKDLRNKDPYKPPKN